MHEIVIDYALINEQSKTHQALKSKYAIKNYKATIIVSVVVHIILFYMIFIMTKSPQLIINKPTKKAIESYLYKMPVKPKPPPKIIPELVKTPVEKNIIHPESKVAKKIEKANLTKKAVAVTKPIEVMEENASISNNITPKKAMPASFSAYKQLNNLRDTINKQAMEKTITELQQFRSPSLMHGEQIPVPHSNVQLTPEQEREKNTTKMSDSISITKYDNGLCIIEREQFLGSPVEGSISAFSCGESKFDQNFRAHMKKVRDKNMPVNTKTNK